jgi:signal transduction histidine kinase
MYFPSRLLLAITLLFILGSKMIGIASENTPSALFQKSRDAMASGDCFEAMQMGIEANAAAKRSGNRQLSANILAHLGEVYECTGKDKDAIKSYILAGNYFAANKNLRRQGQVMSKLGELYLKKGILSMALSTFLKGHNLGINNNIDSMTSTFADNIGMVYLQLGNFSMAQKYLDVAVKLRKKNNDKSGLAYTHGNLALLFDQQGKDSLAIYYYNQTLQFCTQHRDTSCMANVYNNMGVFYEDRQQAEKALDNYKHSLSLTDSSNHASFSVICCNMANIYFSIRKYADAMRYAKQAYRHSIKSPYVEDQRDVLKVLRKISLARNDWQTAYQYLEKSAKLTESMQKQASEKGVMQAEMENRLLLQKNKQELEKKLLAEKYRVIELHRENNDKLMRWGLLGMFAVVMAVSFFLVNIHRSNLRYKAAMEEMKEVNRQQQALSGIVAHDLKTPLTQIRGLVSLLRMDGHLSKSQQEIADNMLSAADGGLSLLSDIIVVNQIETEVYQHLQEIKIVEVIEDICNSHSMQLHAKQITLITKLDASHGIRSTKDSLGRMADNLLSNAIKYSPPLSVIEVRSEKKPEGLFIHFKDKGAGILQEEKSLLFRKFQKLSNKPTQGESSHGLGLYIVKLLADRNGAQVLVDSEPGKGSVFTLFYPSNLTINS